MESAARDSRSRAPHLREVLAVCSCVLAGAVAGGVAGLVAEPLRIAGTWLLLGSAFLLTWRGPIASSCGWRAFWPLGGLALLIALPAFGLGNWLHEVLVVSAVSAWLAANRRGPARCMLTIVSAAVLVWAALLLTARSVPSSWHVAERAGQVLGHFAAALTDRPLEIGAAFGGVELLVLVGLLYGGWLCATAGSKRRRLLVAAAAVGSMHLLYLVTLSSAHDLVELLPDPPEPEFRHPYEPPDWRWSAAIGTLVPWNLPLLAAVLQAAMLGLIWRWSHWPEPGGGPVFGSLSAVSGRWKATLALGRAGWMVGVLAVVLAAAATLCGGRADLTGKTLLADSRGRLDWERPQHDRYGRASAGTFGMLPLLVQSLGGTLRIEQQWSEANLSEADAVLLLHPTESVSAEQREQVLRYVREGGALLLAAEPHRREGDLVSGHNSWLSSTAISVRRDVAAAEPSGWQHALQWASHPVTAGGDGRRSPYFRELGSSLDIRWPARPLIVGRWGWSDPGSDALFSGVQQLEPGERLGDLVLAAEQSYGDGRIVVLANSFSLTNEGGVAGCALTGRLLHYLAGTPGGPQRTSRQLLTLAVLAAFCLLVLAAPDPRRLLWFAALLSISLGISQQVSRHLTRVVPDGRLLNPDGGASRLAYIDASHLEAYSNTHWSFDGINGLALTLMRNGLLTASLPELTAERLERAGMLISIAPSRRFSHREQRLLEDFVHRGGILICTTGGEEAAASDALLARFGIRVLASPVPSVSRQTEPEPMGRIRSPYLEVDRGDGSSYSLAARFHAGWPVQLLTGDGGKPLAYGRPQEPVAVWRRVGQGTIVVIGDTGFALNKNLEYIGGEPFEGRYENAAFWRWLLSELLAGESWIPPAPAGEENAADGGQEGLP